MVLTHYIGENCRFDIKSTNSMQKFNLHFYFKVLSMYMLSALFKDSRVGEDVLLYAESALIIAITGFDSVFWNVRNASTLLFSSLMNRIFGVNRSREEISKKNR